MKILLQHRQFAGLSRVGQVRIAPAKPMRLSQHGDCGSTSCLVRPCLPRCRNPLVDIAPRGRGPLDLRDHGDRRAGQGARERRNGSRFGGKPFELSGASSQRLSPDRRRLDQLSQRTDRRRPLRKTLRFGTCSDNLLIRQMFGRASNVLRHATLSTERYVAH